MNTYPVELISNDSLTNYFSEEFNPVFIIDENVFAYHQNGLLAGIPQERIFIFPSGEVNKNLDTLTRIWDFLILQQADRSTVALLVGGGVTTDAGAFACATYKRGIPYILIPTTLLAMVDATIGGKTGINYHHIKNLLGSFNPPKKVGILRRFLSTLPERELRSGLAEMLKHALISDRTHWESIINAQNEFTDDMILKSIQIKSAIVTQDPYEKGIRKILNFGHTIGHAIESLLLGTEYEFSHGEAVALGMVLETELAVNHRIASPTLLQELRSVLKELKFPMQIPNYDENKLKEFLCQDKKNERSTLKLSVISDFGQPVLDFSPPLAEILAVMRTYAV